MSATPSESGFRLTGRHVLLMVVAFFGVIIAADAFFTVLALRSFPGQVSVTPYEDGLMYNRKLAQLEAQARLGWRAAAAAEPEAVTLEFRDRTGGPVQGLKITGRLERPATEAGRITLAFVEASPGRYVARPGRLDGVWDLSAVAIDPAGHRFEAGRRLTWP